MDYEKLFKEDCFKDYLNGEIDLKTNFEIVLLSIESACFASKTCGVRDFKISELKFRAILDSISTLVGEVKKTDDYNYLLGVLDKSINDFIVSYQKERSK